MSGPSSGTDYRLFIGGEFAEAAGGEWFDTYDPSTGKPWARVAKAGPADAARAAEAAQAAFENPAWRGITATARGRMLTKLGDLVLENAEHLARAETRDNGKSIQETRGQVKSLATWYHYYGGLADKVQGEVIPTDRPGALNYTLMEPYGVVLAILPWNSPLRITSWKLAPALAAGNTVIVKPSEHTSTSILEMAPLFAEAGFPPGVVNVLTGFGADIVPALIEHPYVRKITFTGGPVGGRLVAEAAGRNLKPVSLELGGKSPQVVFADADLDKAAEGVALGIFSSSGQTCVAGSRLLVDASIHDELVKRVVDVASRLRYGDPNDEATLAGPAATRAQFETISGFIKDALAEGATLALGGLPEDDGTSQLVEPTVFTGVAPSHRLFREEVFGPVLAVTPFNGEAEAVRLANALPYGLAAGVWTRDVSRAHRMAAAIQSGMVWVNGYRVTSPLAPFGGYKSSGIGRESGTDAIKEFLQVKSVWLNLQ